MTTNEMIEAYAAKVQQLINTEYSENYPRSAVPAVSVQFGKRYARIVASGHGVHSFVDMTNGNILKAATWKAPYTKGPNPARGNVFRLAEGGFNHYGADYRYR